MLTSYRLIALVIWCLAVMPGPALGDGNTVMVEQFESRVTSDYPEVNVIVRNLTDVPMKTSIFFSIEHLPAAEGWAFTRSTVGNYYLDYHTTAVVPGSGWAHRVFRAGPHIASYPATVRYTIAYGDKFENLITGEVTLNDQLTLRTPLSVELAEQDLKLEHNIEAMERNDAKLVRILITNLSAQHGQLYVSRKDLIGCTDTFDFRHPITRGLDGGIVDLPPQGKGVVIIPITGSKSVPECRLDLEFSSREVEGRGRVITSISIPLVVTGKYWGR
ncbi:MAG: hypothetical protein EPO31_05210 [Gammaproteobacteria bacterium]|nr:MAG: hypothetical protein EPO31_05210 [Gammaproteobacteria bacterium]